MNKAWVALGVGFDRFLILHLTQMLPQSVRCHRQAKMWTCSKLLCISLYWLHSCVYIKSNLMCEIDAHGTCRDIHTQALIYIAEEVLG